MEKSFCFPSYLGCLVIRCRSNLALFLVLFSTKLQQMVHLGHCHCFQYTPFIYQCVFWVTLENEAAVFGAKCTSVYTIGQNCSVYVLENLFQLQITSSDQTCLSGEYNHAFLPFTWGTKSRVLLLGCMSSWGQQTGQRMTLTQTIK